MQNSNEKMKLKWKAFSVRTTLARSDLWDTFIASFIFSHNVHFLSSFFYRVYFLKKILTHGIFRRIYPSGSFLYCTRKLNFIFPVLNSHFTRWMNAIASSATAQSTLAGACDLSTLLMKKSTGLLVPHLPVVIYSTSLPLERPVSEHPVISFWGKCHFALYPAQSRQNRHYCTRTVQVLHCCTIVSTCGARSKYNSFSMWLWEREAHFDDLTGLSAVQCSTYTVFS